MSGDFDNLEKFLESSQKNDIKSILESAGEEGVKALSDATPKNTGSTAESWSYEIEETPSGYSVYWSNSNTNDGVNIALIIQTGHGTRNGGYVQGIDYINPAAAKVFDKIADEVWKGVNNL